MYNYYVSMSVKFRLKPLILIVLLLVNTAVFNTLEAEEGRIDPHKTGEGYASVLYDNTNGLPTSEANAIAETEEGFI